MTTTTTTGVGASSGTVADGHLVAAPARLVLAGGLDTAGAIGRLSALSHPPRDGPATLMIDLRQRTFVAVPRLRSGETRLVLTGELDLATTALLSEGLAFVLGRRSALATLDLRHLEFIDARSAGLIGTAAERMGRWDGAMTLRHARAPVRRVLGLCRLGHLLEGRGGCGRLEGVGG